MLTIPIKHANVSVPTVLHCLLSSKYLFENAPTINFLLILSKIVDEVK